MHDILLVLDYNQQYKRTYSIDNESMNKIHIYQHSNQVNERGTRGTRETKEAKETKEMKEARETKETIKTKETKETKETRERCEGKLLQFLQFLLKFISDALTNSHIFFIYDWITQ